jgi:hypothetical protein
VKLTVLFPSTLVASAILLSITTISQAVTTQFTDLATFNANTTGMTTIDFEGLAPSPGSIVYGATGLTISGVNFQGPIPDYLTALDDPTFFNFSPSANLYTPVGSITAILPAGINAIGFDLLNTGGSLPYIIALSNGETFSFGSSPLPSRKFAGFISSLDIASISVGRGNSFFTALDNFKFGTADNTAMSVPEPFTIIGTIVGGTAAFRMRKKLKFAPIDKK